MKVGKKNPFEAEILLDQEAVQTGSALRGRVVLPEEANKASIKTIKILFVGQEKTQVTHRRTNSHSTDIDDHNHTPVTELEKYEVCNYTLLDKFYDKGQKVDQSLPFQFDIPENLPASVTLGMPDLKVGLLFKKKCDYGVLFYRVKVKIERRGMLKGTLGYEKVVSVNTKPKTVTVGTPFEFLPQIKAPKIKKLFGRGNEAAKKIFIGARIPTGNHVLIGQNLTVDVSVVNLSKSPIDKVEMTVQEIHRWEANKYKKTGGDNLVAKSFGWLGDSVMNPPPESASCSQPAELQRRMRKELDEGTHRQTLTVPNFAQAYFFGKLVSVTHVLRIHVKTKKEKGPADIEIPLTLLTSTSHASTPIGKLVTPLTNRSKISARTAVIHNTPVSPTASGSKVTPQPTESIHRNVQCDGCQQYPLRGVRYHCPKGKHDYCLTCYEKNHRRCLIDRGDLTKFAGPTAAPLIQATSFDQANPYPLTQPTAPYPPMTQGFHPLIDRKVGEAAVWEDSPLPQATGVSGWLGKQVLRATLNVDPYAPMARQVPPVPFAPIPPTRLEEVSVLTLRAQLSKHPDPVSVLVQDLQQPDSGSVWRALFAQLSPGDFGDIVGSVPQNYRQAPVAEKLVPMVHDFSCQHLVEALEQAHCDAVRNRMLATLTGYCVDLAQNKCRVKATLNETEQAFFRSGIGYGRLCG